MVNIAIAESYVEDSLKATFLGINFQIMAIARSIATLLAEYLYRTYNFTTVRTYIPVSFIHCVNLNPQVCIFSALGAALCSGLYFVSIRLRANKTRQTDSKVTEASTENETSATQDPEVGEAGERVKANNIAVCDADVTLNPESAGGNTTTVAET